MCVSNWVDIELSMVLVNVLWLCEFMMSRFGVFLLMMVVSVLFGLFFV